MADVKIVTTSTAIRAESGATVTALRFVNGVKSGDLEYYASNPPYGTTDDAAFTWAATGGGYWVRVSDYASPLFWGATVGGSASTNRAALQGAFDFCWQKGMELRLNFMGTLDIDDELKLPNLDPQEVPLVGEPFPITGQGRSRTVIRQTAQGKHLIRLTDDVLDAAWRDFKLTCDSDAGHIVCMGAVSAYTIDSISTSAPYSFTVQGTGAGSTIAAGDVIRVRGGAGTNDRTYTVVSVSTGGGNTTITVVEAINSSTAQGSVEWMEAKSFTRNLIQNVDFAQNNTAYSVLYGLWNSVGGFFFNRFDHIRLLGESGNTAPLVDIATNGNYVASNMFIDVWAHFTSGGGDYVARVANHSAGTFIDQLVFENWLVEAADGGVIHLIGAAFCTIRNVQMFDNGTLTKDLIKLEANSDTSAQPSWKNLIEMIVRHAGTPNGFYDIAIGSSQEGNILNACQGTVTDPLEIQFNSNPAAMIGDKNQNLDNASNINILSST